jgi:rubrerythrin
MRGGAVSGLTSAIREAIRKEKTAYDLYRLVNATTTNPTRRQFAQRLADDALRHLGIIERACKTHSPGLATFLQHIIPQTAFTDNTEDELVEALESAAEHKRELVELYTVLSNQESEPHWNEMFRALVETEEAHLEFVRTHLPSVR